MAEKYSEESLFCVKYLNERGYLAQDKLEEMAALLDDFKVDFKLVKIHKDFFTDLAAQLRELWPKGNKDGLYPWRDSVENLSRRLKVLWTERGMKDYTIDQCLMVARQYLARFETDAKYMKTLKYFIYKNNETILPDGRKKFTFDSEFANLLENITDEEKEQSEWESMFNASMTQGTLV